MKTNLKITLKEAVTISLLIIALSFGTTGCSGTNKTTDQTVQNGQANQSERANEAQKTEQTGEIGQTDQTEEVEQTDQTGQENSPNITKGEFNKINSGMTYEEVVSIVGGEGFMLSETEAEDPVYKTNVYIWNGDNNSNAMITFQGGAVVSKSETGLK